MKLIKLLLLLVLPFGSLAFACGTSNMTYQNGGQTNTSSGPCPNNSGASGPPPVNNNQSTTYSAKDKAAEDAAKAAGKVAEDQAKRAECKKINYKADFCTVYKIEAEAKEKFCAEYPVEVDLAVYKCSLDASSYRDYFVGRYCDSGESGTWNFNASIKNASVSFGTDIKSGGFCRDDASNALEASRLRCQYSGMVVQDAVKKQCSDVN